MIASPGVFTPASSKEGPRHVAQVRHTSGVAWLGTGVSGAVKLHTIGAPAARLKVLLVMQELSLTGAPRLALEAFRALGDDIDLRTISGFGGPLEGSFRDLGRVRVLKRLPGRFDDWQHPAKSTLAKGYGRISAPVAGMDVRRWRPDVVYVNSVIAITLAARLRLGRFPTLLHVHELRAALERMSASHLELLGSLPHRYVAVSNAVADELVLSRGVPRDRVSVIPPPINVSRVTKMAEETESVIADADPRAAFLVGGAGYPHWTKGIELWLLMARALIDRVGQDAVRFEWVGVREDDAAVEFRTMVRKLSLESNVRLIAETTNPYLHYRLFDTLAITSWEESASLVALESMALGVPVVCFAGSGGPPEELGDAGVIVDRFSPWAMADSIAELMDDPGRRSLITSKARARVEAINSPERIAKLLSEELAIVAARSADR